MLETRRTIVEICDDYNTKPIGRWEFPKRNITGASFDTFLGLCIVAALAFSIFAFGFESVLNWVFGTESRRAKGSKKRGTKK